MTVPFLRPDQRAAFLAEHEPDHGTERQYVVSITATFPAELAEIMGPEPDLADMVTVTAHSLAEAKDLATVAMTIRPMGHTVTMDVVRCDG